MITKWLGKRQPVKLLLSLLAVTLSIVLLGQTIGPAAGSPSSTPGVIDFILIDADPLTPGIQTCRSVVAGGTFSIDFTVDEIDPVDSNDFASGGNVGFNFATGDFVSPSIDFGPGAIDDIPGFVPAPQLESTTKAPGRTHVGLAYFNPPPVSAPSLVGQVIAARATLTAGTGAGLKTIEVTLPDPDPAPLDGSFDTFFGATEQIRPAAQQGIVIAIGQPCDPPENTSVGTNVSTPLNGGLGSVGGIEVTYTEVTLGGTTTVATSTSGPPPPVGLTIVGIAGQPLYYDISTSATFSGPVTVCIKYDETEVIGPESGLRLMHEAAGGFDDITDLPVDTLNDIICGTAASLSTFILTEPEPTAVGGIVEIPAMAGGSGADPSLESADSPSARHVALLMGGLAAGGLALTAGGWYARRRWLR